MYSSLLSYFHKVTDIKIGLNWLKLVTVSNQRQINHSHWQQNAMEGKNQNTDDMQAEQSRCLKMNFTINMGKLWITEVLDIVHHLMLKIVINKNTTFWKQISPCTHAKHQYCNTYRHCVYMCTCVCVWECIHSHVYFTILLVKDRICLC